MAESGPTSILVVEELFAAGSPQFLAALRTMVDPAPMAAFAERWLRDPRPWARQQMLACIDLPLTAGHYNSLVKRLFKGIEARNDDELMAAWARSFDRLVRRVRRKHYRWDYRARQAVYEERLVAPHDRLHYFPGHCYQNPRTKEWIVYGQPRWLGQRLFSHHTRYYLRRRAWRYFRWMGFRRPGAYVPAVAAMIAGYTDEDLATGDNLMDCWSLLHACFGESDAIGFMQHRAFLRGGQSLAKLEAAPAFSTLWQDTSSAGRLLSLLTAARSTFARVWAMDLLRRWHKDSLVGLPVDQIVPLLSHADESIWQIGIELFENAAGLDTLSVDRWYGLLRIRNLAVLDVVVAAMKRHVPAESITLFDAAKFACTEAAPIARLGLHYLQAKPIDTPQQRQALVNLADARSAAVGYEIAAWALGHLGSADVYDVDQASRFFDSLLAEVRSAARDWLAGSADVAVGIVSGSADVSVRLSSIDTGGRGRPRSQGWNDPTLWARLLESPFEDIREFLVDQLERRSIPGATNDAIAQLWTGVLLNIHRGGRKKLSALRQISDAVRADPAKADRLMPVLAVAIRSVRVPETRAGLSAVVSAVATRPDLAPIVRREIPELELNPTPLGVEP